MTSGIQRLGKTLGESMKQSKARGETQGLQSGGASSLFVFADYKFRVRVTKVLIETQSIGGDTLIWGNATFGIWNSFKWGNSATTSFILGNSLAGVLGTSKLGSQSSSYQTVEEIILTQTIPIIAKQEIAKWIASESATSPTHMALGTSSTEYTDSDTALGTEIARKTISIDVATDKKVEYEVEILSTDTAYHSDTFREVGLLNNSVGGTLFSRNIISALNLDSATNARITVTYDLSDISAGTALFTTAGLNQIRNWLGSSSATAPGYTAWGTGTSATAPGDTTLEGETERNAFSTTNRVGNLVTFESILTKGEANGDTITKSGNFNAATVGTLFTEVLYGGINKSSLFKIFETDRMQVL